MPSDDRLEALMRGLRAQYLADADERVAELRRSLVRVEAREPASLDDLRRLFHKLAGSGGSYGLDDVTAHSREGERAAKRLLDALAPPEDVALADLTAHVQRVADAFAAAKRAGPEGSVG